VCTFDTLLLPLRSTPLLPPAPLSPPPPAALLRPARPNLLPTAMRHCRSLLRTRPPVALLLLLLRLPSSCTIITTPSSPA
jgi:hypothetical protein